MKTASTGSEIFESTYALLVRSEEKQRSRLETMIYMFLIVSAAFAVSQFARQAAMMPPSTARVSATASSFVQHRA